jgi:integrase
MPRARTGSLEKRRRKNGTTYYRARIRLADGSRVRVDVPKKYATEDDAEVYALAVQEREDERGELLEKKRAREAERAKQRDPSNGETVALWSERWLAARRARGLRSVATDEFRMSAHVLPRLGSSPVAKVTRADLEAFVEHLDARVRATEKPIAWKTASHVWGLVTRMFADASGAKQRHLRVREDNPALGVHGPDRGVRKAKQYLWPSELLALVSCPDVPLAWRRAFAVTTYLYARAGEVNALRWEDVDLERGVVHIHRSVDRDTGDLKPTKTSAARRLPIEPALRPLLDAMHEECGGEGRVLQIEATDRKLSRQLQRCLRVAGVEREELYVTDETRKAITFHDLRATGITWAAVRGDDAVKVKQRAGHSTLATTESYIREAENLRDGFGDVFPALPESLYGPRIGPSDLRDVEMARKKVEALGIETCIAVTRNLGTALRFFVQGFDISAFPLGSESLPSTLPSFRVRLERGKDGARPNVLLAFAQRKQECGYWTKRLRLTPTTNRDAPAHGPSWPGRSSRRRSSRRSTTCRSRSGSRLSSSAQRSA